LRDCPPEATSARRSGGSASSTARRLAAGRSMSPLRWIMTTSKSPAAPPRCSSAFTVRLSADRTLAPSPAAMEATWLCA
jgi:hypothetical protein